MNRLLSSSLGVLNALLALAIIAAGVLRGMQETAANGQEVYHAIIGGAIGVIVATLVCGLVATFIEMREMLREILEELRRGR